jgi:hypothetical protein
MNFEDIKRELGLADSTRNGFLTKEFDDTEHIYFSLKCPISGKLEFIVCAISVDEGGVYTWSEFDEMNDDAETIFKFMKEQNVELPKLDPLPELFGESARVVTYHGNMFRMENEYCTFFFCEKFMWGNETEYGHSWIVKPGEKVNMTWYQDEIVFTFENVVAWLRSNGYAYRR